MNISDKIKYYRGKKEKISQRELGRRIKKTGQFISLIEQDKSKPSLETLKKIADALNVSVNDLLEDTNESELLHETITNVSEIADAYVETSTKTAIEGLKSLAIYTGKIDEFNSFLLNGTDKEGSTFLDDMSMFFEFELYKFLTEHKDNKK